MDRCALCPGVNKCLPPDGPEDSDILLIGEAPGRQENAKGRVFIGKTGQELDSHYLPLSGRRRDTIRIVNAISCLPVGPDGKIDLKRDKDRALLECCSSQHLLPELNKKHRVIVPMGAFACHAIDPTIDLELQHGIPVMTKWGWAFPMYHPAGGIHEPKAMLKIRTDWTRLRKWLIGKLRVFKDEYEGQEQYEVITSPSHLDSWLSGCNDYTLANDTETKKGGEPFCLTASIQPGTGILIKSTDTAILSRYQYYLDRWRGPILWHNWLFDGAVVKRMGLSYRHKLIVDTMVRTFHLGNLPQGLKALADRELGMEMQDFNDLVTPYASSLVLDYYRDLYAEEWPTPDPETNQDKTGRWHYKQPQNMHTKLKRFFTDLKKNPEKDIFEIWEKNWGKNYSDMLEDRCGPWPGKCISYVPFDEAVYYAIRDADALLRLWPVIQKMSNTRLIRKAPQENWRDAA